MTGTVDGIRFAPRPEIGAPRPWTFPAVEERRLDNGLQLVLCHLPQRPMLDVEVLVRAPREGEPRDLEGVASITAQALREGAGALDAEAFVDELEGQGATIDTWAAYAGLRANLGVPASRAEAGLRLLVAALSEPALPAREVDRLVRTRLDHIERERAQPGIRASHEMRAAHFDPGERLSRPDGGTAETVGRIDRDAVTAFYEAHTDPAVTTVVVGGDLADGSVVAAVERTLGPWRGRGLSAAAPRRPATQPEGRLVLVDRPGAAQSELRFTRVGPTRHEAQRWAASSLAAFSLGGGMMSRLMQSLREEKGWTYGVGAAPNCEGPAGWVAAASAVETAVTAPAVELALAEMARLARDGVTAEEHRFAAGNLLAAPRRMETPGALARTVMNAVEDGLPAGWHRDYYPLLEATALDTVNAAASEDWRPGLLVVVVGDAAVVEEPLRALGSGDVQVLR